MSRCDVTVDLAYLNALEDDSKRLTLLKKAAEEFVRLYEGESLGQKSDTFKELRYVLAKS